MLNFPDAPTTNQVFINGALAWQWTGTKWTILPNGATPYLPLVGGQISGSPGSLTVGAPTAPAGGMLTGDLNASRVIVNGTPLTLPVSVPNGGTGATNFPLIPSTATLGLAGVLPLANGTGVFTASSWAPSTANPASLNAYGTNSWIQMNVCGGTLAAPTATPVNRATGGVYFSGHNGSDWASGAAAIGLEAYATQTWTTGANGQALRWYTTPNGATVSGVKMALDGGGNLTIAGYLFHSSSGLGAPTFTTRSAGSRVVLWGGLSGTDVDYALGMDAGTLWSSIPNSTAAFRWYAGTALIMTLGGGGGLTTTGAIASGSSITVGGSGDLVMARTDNAYGAFVRPNTAGLKKFYFCTIGGQALEEVRINGPLTACGFMSGGGQLRMTMDPSGNGYGAFFHNDSNDTYLLLTNNNDAFGGFNGLRPFRVHNADGSVYMENGLTVLGRVISNYNTRAGTPAAMVANNAFNIEWTGTAQLWIDNVNLGQIAFVSDYRTKENVAALPSMWDKVKALRPISYNRRDCEELLSRGDPTERWGFVAHELQETLTESAASGYKDAPNEVQSPDLPTLLATTVRALQEAMGRIEMLEAQRG